MGAEMMNRQLKRMGKKAAKSVIKYLILQTAPVWGPIVVLFVLAVLGYQLLYEMPKQAILGDSENRVADFHYGSTEGLSDEELDLFQKYPLIAERWKADLIEEQMSQVEPYRLDWRWLAAVDRTLNEPTLLNLDEAHSIHMKPLDTLELVRPRFDWMSYEEVTRFESCTEQPNPEWSEEAEEEVSKTIYVKSSGESKATRTLLKQAITIQNTYSYAYEERTRSNPSTESACGPLSSQTTYEAVTSIMNNPEDWLPLRRILKDQGIDSKQDQDFLLEYWLSFIKDDGIELASPYSGALADGQLLVPVQGKITSPFSNRINPVTGLAELHTGIDIGAQEGTPIRAAKTGTVIYAAPMGTAGNAIILQHEDLETRYYHLSLIGVIQGQIVQAGEVIGQVGSTGRVTGPHLHFEVRVSGQPVNPLAYFNKPTFEIPSEISYRPMNVEKVSVWLASRDSALAKKEILQMIDEAARQTNVDPLLLLSITGQEQSFVPAAHPQADKIIRNPWNVFGSWAEGKGATLTTEEAARIAAETVVKLSQNRPSDVETIQWLVDRRNPNGIYAEDPNWWIGVSQFYETLSKL